MYLYRTLIGSHGPIYDAKFLSIFLVFDGMATGRHILHGLHMDLRCELFVLLIPVEKVDLLRCVLFERCFVFRSTYFAFTVNVFILLDTNN